MSYPFPDPPQPRPDQPAWYRSERCPQCGKGIVWNHCAAVPRYECKHCPWVETRFDGARNAC